jgi:cephalosporin hydroxylase
MILTIDTSNRTLDVRAEGQDRSLPLFSREAFEVLSDEWVRVGWALKQYFTFTWMGLPVLQLPEDLVRVQEVIATLRPDVIVETGVYQGGSMLFHASICEALGKGRVIGIDKYIAPATAEAVRSHRLANRIRLIEGDSADPETLRTIRADVGDSSTVMVLLDSDHTKQHVRKELEAYSPLVTPGSCIVAADGIMRILADVPHGEPDWTTNNPSAAAREFAAAHPEFELRDPAWQFNQSDLEKNVTYWPDGWLWRKV